MRRADRLFQIVQHLRGRRLTTAAQLAGWLQVSERTIYRDIRDLSLTGVPVEGEAGVGYRLAPQFDLPPMMFTFEEVEALAGGLRMLESWGSPELRRAVVSARAKIVAALPESRRIELDRTRLFAPDFLVRDVGALLDTLRGAIAGRGIMRLEYLDKEDRPSQRDVWPLGLYFWGQTWALGAWCVMRQDFRNFRLDRITSATPSGERYPDEEGRRVEDFVRKMKSS